MKHLLLTAFCGLTASLVPCEAQIMPTEILYVNAHMKIEDNPWSDEEDQGKTLQKAWECQNEIWPACAEIQWNSMEPPLLHTEYTARIPTLITLHGLKHDILLAPFVRCTVFDRLNRSYDASPPGPGCTTTLRYPGQLPEWVIGGFFEGAENAPPGEYTGSMLLQVKGGGKTYESLVEIAYNRWERKSSCTFSVIPPKTIPELFYGSGDTSESEIIKVILDAEPGAGDVHVTITSTGNIPGFTVTPNSLTLEEQNPPSRTYEGEFTVQATTTNTTPVGEYEQTVTLTVSCPS